MIPGAPTLPTAQRWRSWGVDPGWSRVVAVEHTDGVRQWHVLDRAPARPLATVVCVHGNPTWSYLWRHLIERLGDRYRVVAVDQLGMGFSERTERRRYAQRVADLAAIVEALDVAGPMFVVGHDWGGAISLGWSVDAAARHDLAGIVLCNTGIAVPAGRSAPRLIRIAAAGPVTGAVGHRTRVFVDGTVALSRARLTATDRAALRAPYARAEHRRAVAEFVDDVPFSTTHPSAAAIADVAERLRSCRTPALLAWGAADPVFDDSFAHDLADRLPHAQRHRFARSGHLSPLESDVAGVVDAWLGREDVRMSEPPHRAVAPVWAALEERRDDPDTAFIDGATGASISFSELHRRVMATAGGMRAVGIEHGDRVALLVPPGIDLVVAVYACWRAGAVTVIADRGLGLRGLGAAIRSARASWIVGVPQALAAARALRWAPGARTIVTGDRVWFGAVGSLDQLARSGVAVPPPPAPNDPAAVLFTSGATGPAKGVRYRHAQLSAQRDALAATYGITRADRLVAAFAPFALYGPALGIPSTIPDVDVTSPGSLTAAALGAATEAIGGTIVFASPAALANTNRTSSALPLRPDPRLSGVRLVLSAGAPVPVATLRATGHLVPSATMHTPYGMTECLPVADISLDDITAAGSGRGVCVGRAVDGADVMIAGLDMRVDQPFGALPAGVTGEVLVRAPWCSDGYDVLWRTERDARPIDAHGNVWHRSGDVGHLDASGRLWIEGRAVHVIRTVDGPVTPVPVEVAVETLEGIERAAAVGVGPQDAQQLVVVVESSDGDGLARTAVATTVRAVVQHPVSAVLTVADLPVDIRHNTKIDRARVAAWAEVVLAGGRTKHPW